MAPTRELAKPKRKGEEVKDLAEITETFEPEDEIKALLQEAGVPLVPPEERTGTHAVKWSGRNFQLPAEPEPLGLRESAEILEKKADEEEQTITVSEVIDALPWDGAQAFMKAVEALFGWGILQPERFLWMKIPPVMRSIKTGPGNRDTMQVFWGQVFIPQIGAVLKTEATRHQGRTVFGISGEIEKRKRYQIEKLVALARIFANQRSIYKGKAIRMFATEKGRLDFDREPEFIKVDPNLMNELVFAKKVQDQLNTNLFAPIMYPLACRELGIPLKRGILLEGKYGVGKSMTAAVTATLAIQHGWTFIMISQVSALKDVLDFAHRYAPVVVFAEDVDRSMSGDQRTVNIDDVLNTLDGVQGKAHEIITVLTTNHADKINRALLRPGRLDAVITIEPPDAEAAEKLMRLYGRGLIDSEEPLPRAGTLVAGQIPAVIREVVERAKLAAVYRAEGVPTSIVDADLVTSAETMADHLGLMLNNATPEPSAAEQLGLSLVEVLRGETIGLDKEIVSDVDYLKKCMPVLASRLGVNLPSEN